MSEGIQKMAKILRITPELLGEIITSMEHITHKELVIEDILSENEESIKRTLALLEVRKNNESSVLHAQDIIKALEDSLIREDKTLFELLGKPDLSQPATSRTLIEKSYEAVGVRATGFFLKKEKAREMLAKTPPPNIIRGLGYKNINELLEHEKLEEIFAALRFIETRDWMNDVFVRHYEALTPEDFEERFLDVFVLQRKWLSLAQTFVKKKYHNVSHLKELGIIFIIPIGLDTPGDTLRLFSLILHYLHEIPFYAALVKQYAKHREFFASRLMSLIRGDVGNPMVEYTSQSARWLIVQRYLAKDDQNDKRLFLPHVNPEAIHWRKAQEDIVRFALLHPALKLSLFQNLDYVGDFFPSRDGGELLVSFDLVDNIMSLVGQDTFVKYLYHHQEALWNRIFAGFLGYEQMENLIVKDMDKGYIELGA